MTDVQHTRSFGSGLIGPARAAGVRATAVPHDRTSPRTQEARHAPSAPTHEQARPGRDHVEMRVGSNTTARIPSDGRGLDSINVLSLDGGGMRGLYSATVLKVLGDRFAKVRGVRSLDVGKGFDLVVGTSTGAILAAGVAAGIPMEEIAAFYERVGPEVFPRPTPRRHRSARWRDKARILRWATEHARRPAGRTEPLESALGSLLGTETMGQLYERRRIGLAISATRLLDHSPRVFKTAHVPSKNRDDELSVVDACLASSAAPTYLPLASITEDGLDGQVFVDGGLWSNNPLMLALIEGLAIARTQQPIVVVSVGTCAAPVGSDPNPKLARGILGWRAGYLPLKLAMDAQAKGVTHAAALLGQQLGSLGKQVDILRLGESATSDEQAPLLKLDAAFPEAQKLMRGLGNVDAQAAYAWTQGDDRCGSLLRRIFERMPEIDDHTDITSEA